MAQHILTRHKTKSKIKSYVAVSYTNTLLSVRRYVDLGIGSESKHNMLFWKQSGREQMLTLYKTHRSR